MSRQLLISLIAVAGRQSFGIAADAELREPAMVGEAMRPRRGKRGHFQFRTSNLAKNGLSIRRIYCAQEADIIKYSEESARGHATFKGDLPPRMALAPMTEPATVTMVLVHSQETDMCVFAHSALLTKADHYTRYAAQS